MTATDRSPRPINQEVLNQEYLTKKVRTYCPGSPDSASVLDHLNNITGSKFRQSATSLKNINARLAEGFTKDDLCAVVDFKFREWGGDPKMGQYLRPSTLFAPEKFAGYLAAARNPIGKFSKVTQSNIRAGMEFING